MISEVLNAIFLTYLVSEYLVATNHLDVGDPDHNRPFHKRYWTRRLWQRHNVWAATILIVINIVERVSGAASFIHHALHQFLQLPKVILILTGYVGALYADCQRCSPSLRVREFARRVGVAFCQFLPIYPFLAIFVSFGFLLLINLFEFLRLPVELLNWPIYYGTLYGPFSLIYWNVKRRILDEKMTLPTSM